ncbi:MAG: hypothetical protein KA386_04565, partial [Leptothrix sp. (in: Bacteria)]|nr:hypothetical protein [Leptothrix sp. (in: b-proteobacteria)]
EGRDVLCLEFGKVHGGRTLEVEDSALPMASSEMAPTPEFRTRLASTANPFALMLFQFKGKGLLRHDGS